MPKKRMSPMELLNKVRSEAKLEDNSDFSKSIAIRLKAGKIKLQLLALDSDHLFKPRTQHLIPTVPEEDNKNEKWLIADCKGEGCPVCQAAAAFKSSGVSLDDVNSAYKPKYPYKNLRALFTQPEHYLLCARVLSDNADEGSYLPKDSEIGSTHLIQFNRMALNNLMSAYEDFMEDAEDNDLEDIPPLFAIFDGDDVSKSLTITCRVTNQPYSCSFTFNRSADVKLSEVDQDKLKLLEENMEVPDEHYDKCVKRIKQIQNYFVGMEDCDKAESDVCTSMNCNNSNASKNSVADDDDLDIDDLL